MENSATAGSPSFDDEDSVIQSIVLTCKVAEYSKTHVYPSRNFLSKSTRQNVLCPSDCLCACVYTRVRECV